MPHPVLRELFGHARTALAAENGMTGRGSAAHNLLAGTLTKYVLLAVSVGTGVFLMPFTVRHLGKPQYGLWMLVASVTYYFGLLDRGDGFPP